MKQNIIIAILVATAVGLGLWLTFGSEKAVAPTASTTQTGGSATVESTSNVTVGESFTGNGSFLELMGMGRNLVCDFTYIASETNAAVAGTIKVSREKMRGDFEMEQAGAVYESHMIKDGEVLYTWSETPQGTFAMKMLVPEDGSTEPSTAESSRTVDLNNEVDYDCRPWGVDSSVFVPPAGIEFVDMQQLMQGMVPGGNELPSSQ